MKMFVRWIIMLMILSPFLLFSGFKKDDMHVNSNYYLTRSIELAATYYPGLDLSEYEEAISYNDRYVVVYFHLPILATGGGGPSFFYDIETDELLLSYAQY